MKLFVQIDQIDLLRVWVSFFSKNEDIVFSYLTYIECGFVEDHTLEFPYLSSLPPSLNLPHPPLPGRSAIPVE